MVYLKFLCVACAVGAALALVAAALWTMNGAPIQLRHTSRGTE